jgi:hypothetical protein
MNLERDTVVEIAVSFTAVVLFTTTMIVIGRQYYNANGFSPSGAIALVGAIAGFVVLMSVVSYFLAGR